MQVLPSSTTPQRSAPDKRQEPPGAQERGASAVRAGRTAANAAGTNDFCGELVCSKALETLQSINFIQIQKRRSVVFRFKYCEI